MSEWNELEQERVNEIMQSAVGLSYPAKAGLCASLFRRLEFPEQCLIIKNAMSTEDRQEIETEIALIDMTTGPQLEGKL